jgi:hypothetical protein
LPDETPADFEPRCGQFCAKVFKDSDKVFGLGHD